MKKLLLLLFVCANVFSQDIWVVGKTYLFHSENGKHHVFKNRKADSWGYDNAHCRLWVTDQNVLYSMDRNKRIARGEAKKILTDVSETFLTLSVSGQMEVRNEEGRILSTHPSPWSTLPVAFAQTRKYVFALTEADNTLTLHTYNKDFSKVSETSLSEKKDFWNTPKLVADEQTDSVWVGYTVTQAWTIYAPVLEKRNSTGALLHKQEWKERGILFDVCRETNGDALVSRDIPSNSGYTVPVYSFLEGLSVAKSSQTLFAHRENLFMDSLSCGPKEIAFVSRSIFGSDGSTVEIWDRTPKKGSKTLVKLPDQAWKIYSCQVN